MLIFYGLLLAAQMGLVVRIYLGNNDIVIALGDTNVGSGPKRKD